MKRQKRYPCLGSAYTHRDGIAGEIAGGVARAAGWKSDDYVADGAAEIFFEGWVGEVFVWIGNARRQRKDAERRGEEGGVGGGRVDAEREPADDLYFDAGGMRGGLPVLHDGAIGINKKFDGGRNCWTDFSGAEGERRKR